MEKTKTAKKPEAPKGKPVAIISIKGWETKDGTTLSQRIEVSGKNYQLRMMMGNLIENDQMQDVLPYSIGRMRLLMEKINFTERVGKTLNAISLAILLLQLLWLVSVVVGYLAK